MKTIYLPAETVHIPFQELARLIANAMWPETGPGDVRLRYVGALLEYESGLKQAVKNGALPVKNPLTFGPHTFPEGNALLSALVTVDDLRKFVAEQKLPVLVEVQVQSPAESAPGLTENTGNVPLALATGEIAFCFAGIRWSEQGWRKPLGDKPKWLQSCVVTPARQGVSETRWNPVLIGAALVHNGHAQARSVRARFQTKPQLNEWLDAWKTYEADHFDAQ